MKELNLVEILKDCPSGIKLDCIIYDECTLRSISEGELYPIKIQTPEGELPLTKYGSLSCSKHAKCVIFPSKDNRDWSTFKVEKPKWNPDTLQPFDKVLVRDRCEEVWKGDFFVAIECPNGEDYPYLVVSGYYKMIVPYNEDTKHLIATMDEAPEYYRI